MQTFEWIFVLVFLTAVVYAEDERKEAYLSIAFPQFSSAAILNWEKNIFEKTISRR